MARQTATDFIANVRTACGNPPTDELSDAAILQQVNVVYRRLCSKYDHPELDDDMNLTTTAANASVTMTVATDSILQYGDPLNITNSQVMKYITRDQYDWYERGQAQQGSPYYYHIHPSTTAGYNDILLWPVPDGVYSIRMPYQKAPTALVTSPAATSTIIAPVFDEVIEAHAAGKCAAMIGDEKRASIWMQMATGLEKEVGKANRRESEVPYRIIPPGI